MPVIVEKISVDFDPYSEPVNIVTRKCYRCKQVKDIDCLSVAIAPQKVERVEENYMTCKVCREKTKRYGQRHKKQIAEQKRECRAKKWRQNHLNKMKDEVVTCPFCNYEIKKYKQAQHESRKHISILCRSQQVQILRRMFPNLTRSEK